MEHGHHIISSRTQRWSYHADLWEDPDLLKIGMNCGTPRSYSHKRANCLPWHVILLWRLYEALLRVSASNLMQLDFCLMGQTTRDRGNAGKRAGSLTCSCILIVSKLSTEENWGKSHGHGINVRINSSF